MERFSDVSQKYRNLILETSLIRHGCPAVHLLPSRTQRIGRFVKKTIGAEKLSRKNKTILLLGETGSGKSTIINALFNFAIGTEWTDDVWCEIIEDLQPQSQTAEVTVYNVHKGALDFSLRVVDTPGLGDTRGSDELLTHRLLDLFQSEDGDREVHAVGLVLKASENRLTDRMAYVFNTVTSLFDKDMEQKIVPLITHSDGRKPTNALQALETANVKSARDENNKPLYFLFDNCQRDDRTEGTKYLEMAYDTTSKNMENFMKFLQQQESKDLGETVKVLKERISLRENIEKLKVQVQQVKEKEKEMYLSKEMLTQSENISKLTQNFKTEKQKVCKKQQDVDMIGFFFKSGAMCCKTCKENCHFPGCTWARSPSWCAVMKDGKCTKCQCPAEDHVKGDKIYVETFETETITDEEIKEKYEQNEKERKQKEREFLILQKEMSDLKHTKDQSLVKAFQIIEQLKQIALNLNSLSTYVHLDFLIENLREHRDTEGVLKLKEMRDRMDKRNKAGAKYLKTVND